jgi:conjugal transfer/entry exclusion protein
MFYATGQPGWMRFNPGYATSAADPEIEALAQQMQALQNQLDQIQKQLVNLSAKPKED